MTSNGSGKVVLVTGIGGNVGYGILMNIRRSFTGIKIVGTNTSKVSAGNHFCDEVYEVPFALNKEYPSAIKELYKSSAVDLIIPSTDYESFILAGEKESMNIATSPQTTNQIFLDKYLSYKQLNAIGLPFAESVLPSEYRQQYSEYIVKPREGRGSRGILYNPESPEQLSDENIIQPLFKGPEITTGVYITRQNHCHGMITLERQLSNGATGMCEVVTDYDSFLKDYVQTLIAQIPIFGSFNIQSIVTEKGIIPFEINCRISGTNSIRSHFGFKDVEYTLDEYLFNVPLRPVQVTGGSAIRILHDIIYPGISLKDINNNRDNFFVSAEY